MGENRTNVDQYLLRLPEGMRDEISASAKANGRSMNAEIIARLSDNTETLRDKFAGQALAGMFRHEGWINTIDYDQMEVAKRAYHIADAMIAARKAGEA